MARVIRVTEQFQHFVREVKESFWGDLYGQTKLAWKKFFEEESRKERARFDSGDLVCDNLNRSYGAEES